MAGRRIHRFRMARSRAVTAAVVRRTQMRAAFDDLAGNPDLRLARVEARRLRARRADFPECSTPSARRLRVFATTSRPSIPRRCRSCRRRRSRWAGTPAPARCARSRRSQRFSLGKLPCQVLARCWPPGLNSSPQANSAPSRPPRAAYSHSASVGRSLPAHRHKRARRIGDMHDRMIVERVDIALRAVGMAPVGALEKSPPLRPSLQIDRTPGGVNTSEPA